LRITWIQAVTRTICRVLNFSQLFFVTIFARRSIILTTFKLNIPEVNRHQLGEFEEIVMLTVGILYKEAYGVAIIDEIEQRLGRKVSIGALQTVLRRLERKGYLTSELGEATNVRGGKRKRFYSLTTLGSRVLRNTQEQRVELFKAIPRFAFPKR
jgi:PadR family transcriptional regulator, regulatory protein PadR